MDAVVNKAFAVVVVVVGGQETGIDIIGDLSGDGVNGGEFPEDGAGILVEGGFKINVIADGIPQVEAGGVALEAAGDVNVEIAKAEVTQFKGGKVKVCV